ncbi:hypothetical protein CCACVL1_03045 [Corchorus capsularis]|uniref:Uncharacterized protein n=1 Tax=Corchorus capsularis TaxID=210143 RepID=A0A1R3K3H0_COCAP|nr:hypothetical protein CCACVL1_03045 [Corchorus capsularis]
MAAGEVSAEEASARSPAVAVA